MSTPSEIRIANPGWVEDVVDFTERSADDESRMRVAVRLARENVLRATGGPFGAAVFEGATGKLVGVGVNLVVPLNNSTLHAEIVAFMMAQAAVGSYALGVRGPGEHVLYTSCEPCAMCLGATQWSGVKRVVYAATRQDASELFDEGPVFPASYEYLEARGIRFTRGVLRAEGRAVLELYRARGGERYNG
jgi:tRNA(Arg) A34 adenosine deaminase TadA